jgi:metal-responsive CopG/Arc/MetJ family transcriptional regulator
MAITTESKPRPRGAVTHKKARKLISLWVPQALHDQLELAVSEMDSDKSKIIRDALRQHLRRIA